jgi:succinyl-diaminopimelate desuccinylase
MYRSAGIGAEGSNGMTTDSVQLAQKLIRFASLNPPGEEKACADFVADLLSEDGFSIARHEFAPGRPSLVARLAGDAALPPLCFTGHLDVVPLGSAPWRHPPFDAVIADGKLHGRGSSDMKAGIAAFITAALAHRRDGAVFRRGLTFVITAGEETGCEGAFDLARKNALGDCALLIVAEPTSNHPVFAHKGSLRVKVSAKGKTAHSSMPEEGDNAITKITAWMSQLTQHRFAAEHPLLGRSTAAITMVGGGQNINSVPDAAWFTVDFRTLPDHDHAGLLANLAAMFGPQAAIETITDFKGFATLPDEPATAPLMDLLAARLGTRPIPSGAPYFTDASALVPGFNHAPTIVIGPGEAEQCHKTDEYCHVARIIEAFEIYHALIQRMCISA